MRDLRKRLRHGTTRLLLTARPLTALAGEWSPYAALLREWAPVVDARWTSIAGSSGSYLTAASRSVALAKE